MLMLSLSLAMKKRKIDTDLEVTDSGSLALPQPSSLSMNVDKNCRKNDSRQRHAIWKDRGSRIEDFEIWRTDSPINTEREIITSHLANIKANPNDSIPDDILIQLKKWVKPWVLDCRTPKPVRAYASKGIRELNQQRQNILEKNQISIRSEPRKDPRIPNSHHQTNVQKLKLRSTDLEYDQQNEQHPAADADDIREHRSKWQNYCQRNNPTPATPYVVSHLKEWELFKKLYSNRRVVPKYREDEDGWCHVSEFKVQTINANLEMVSNFTRFVHFLEWLGCETVGAAKCRMPPEWKSRPSGNWGLKFKFQAYQQKTKDVNGVAQIAFNNLLTETFTLESFYLRNEKELNEALPNDQDAVIRDFFARLKSNVSLYGKDVLNSVFEKQVKVMNLMDLVNWFRTNGDFDTDDKGEGLIKSYLYISTRHSTFADHKEDYGAGSINFMHAGMPKYWRIIPPSYFTKYINLLQKLAKNSKFQTSGCTKFVLHKQLLPRDEILKQHNIRFEWVNQEAYDYIITFPGSIHGGFASGFSIGEAINYASDHHWIPYIVHECGCRKHQCMYGSNTVINVLPWIRRGYGDSGVEAYLAGTLELGNPYLLPFEPHVQPTVFIKPDGSINHSENPIPVYPLDLRKEDITTGDLIRKFYASKEDKKKTINIDSLRVDQRPNKSKF